MTALVDEIFQKAPVNNTTVANSNLPNRTGWKLKADICNNVE